MNRKHKQEGTQEHSCRRTKLLVGGRIPPSRPLVTVAERLGADVAQSGDSCTGGWPLVTRARTSASPSIGRSHPCEVERQGNTALGSPGITPVPWLTVTVRSSGVLLPRVHHPEQFQMLIPPELPRGWCLRVGDNPLAILLHTTRILRPSCSSCAVWRRRRRAARCDLHALLPQRLRPVLLLEPRHPLAAWSMKWSPYPPRGAVWGGPASPSARSWTLAAAFASQLASPPSHPVRARRWRRPSGGARWRCATLFGGGFVGRVADGRSVPPRRPTGAPRVCRVWMLLVTPRLDAVWSSSVRSSWSASLRPSTQRGRFARSHHRQCVLPSRIRLRQQR